jgi:hypothetical protein
MSLAIILAFAALLLLTLLALLWSRWPAWLKGLLVLAVTALYFYGYEAVHSIWGLPSTDAMPARFVMLASVVEEPNARNKGAIYLWVSVPQEGAAVLAPRSYKLPYSKSLHTQIEEGLRKGRDGVAQMGTAEAKAGSGRGGSGWLKPGNDEQEIKIRDLPSPALPEK